MANVLAVLRGTNSTSTAATATPETTTSRTLSPRLGAFAVVRAMLVLVLLRAEVLSTRIEMVGILPCVGRATIRMRGVRRLVVLSVRVTIGSSGVGVVVSALGDKLRFASSLYGIVSKQKKVYCCGVSRC